jgi:hypothetical protein
MFEKESQLCSWGLVDLNNRVGVKGELPRTINDVPQFGPVCAQASP